MKVKILIAAAVMLLVPIAETLGKPLINDLKDTDYAEAIFRRAMGSSLPENTSRVSVVIETCADIVRLHCVLDPNELRDIIEKSGLNRMTDRDGTVIFSGDPNHSFKGVKMIPIHNALAYGNGETIFVRVSKDFDRIYIIVENEVD